MDTSDFIFALLIFAYDAGSMIISSELGGIIGGVIGGPAGAIIGTLASIGIEALFQSFKDDAVNWVDKKIDDLIEWLSDRLGELVNA